MDWEPAVLEAAQLLVLLFAPQGTVQATARCLLSTRSRKPKRLKHGAVHMRHNLRANSNGAQHVATYGSIKAAVTIRCAEKEVPVIEELVGGLTTSQVSS